MESKRKLLNDIANEVRSQVSAKFLKESIAKPLSDSDLRKLIEGHAKVVLYSNLKGYSSLNELLNCPGQSIFLLYQQAPNYGHWTCLFKQGNRIEFFDPYGINVDDELKWTDPSMRKQLHMDKPWLSKLLYESPPHYTLIYNQHPFQKRGNDINTCGRWCVLRLLFKNLSLEQFVELFGKSNIKKKSLDSIVTLLTIPDLV